MKKQKVQIFIVDYIRTNEAGEDYHRELPPDLFKAIYKGFELFGLRAKPGDAATMTLGFETWSVKAA